MKKGSKGFVSIKVDLEKVYDCLHWVFPLDTLVEVGLSHEFVDLIMACLSSSSMSVLFNRECKESFRSSKGVRQGDLLSTYLFVLCMERLAHLIDKAVEEWS